MAFGATYSFWYGAWKTFELNAVQMLSLGEKLDLNCQPSVFKPKPCSYVVQTRGFMPSSPFHPQISSNRYTWDLLYKFLILVPVDVWNVGAINFAAHLYGITHIHQDVWQVLLQPGDLQSYGNNGKIKKKDKYKPLPNPSLSARFKKKTLISKENLFLWGQLHSTLYKSGTTTVEPVHGWQTFCISSL